jgi:hypothetical protein
MRLLILSKGRKAIPRSYGDSENRATNKRSIFPHQFLRNRIILLHLILVRPGGLHTAATATHFRLVTCFGSSHHMGCHFIVFDSRTSHTHSMCASIHCFERSERSTHGLMRSIIFEYRKDDRGIFGVGREFFLVKQRTMCDERRG